MSASTRKGSNDLCKSLVIAGLVYSGEEACGKEKQRNKELEAPNEAWMLRWQSPHNMRFKQCLLDNPVFSAT